MTCSDASIRIKKFKIKTLAVAMGAMFAAMAGDGAMAGTQTIGDATTTAVTTGNDVLFSGSGGNITGVGTVADAVNIVGADATINGAGELRFAGSSTVSGSVGQNVQPIGLITLNGVAGKTVTFTNGVIATNLSVGAGAAIFNQSMTSTVNFAGNGTLSVAADKGIVGNITNTATGNGVLNFASPTTSTTDIALVTGTTGSTGAGLLAVNVAPSINTYVYFEGLVKAATITNSGEGLLTLRHGAVGNIVISDISGVNGGSVTVGPGGVTGSVEGSIYGTGSLNLDARVGVSGNIGNTNYLSYVEANSYGGVAAFGGVVNASAISLYGTGSTIFADNVSGTVSIMNNGSVTVAADKKIVGQINNATTLNGTLNFAANSTNLTLVTSGVGSTGAGLLAINVAPVANTTATFTGRIKAATITNAGAGTLAFSGATGNVILSGGGNISVLQNWGITGSVDNTGIAGTGTLNMGTFRDISGNVGNTNPLALVTAGRTIFGGIVRATSISLAGTDQTTFKGDVTGAVSFTADGWASLYAGKKIVGSVDSAVSGQGTLSIGSLGTGGAGGVTVVSGAVGATNKLLAVSVNSTGGAIFGGVVKATEITLSGTGGATFTGGLTATTVNLSNTAGTTILSEDATATEIIFGADNALSVAASKKIVGALTAWTTGQGTVNFLGSTTTGGDIGVTAGNKLLAANFQDGAVSIGNNISATTIGFNGTSASTFTAARTLTATGGVTLATGASWDVGTVGTTVAGAFTTGAATTLKTTLTSATATGKINVTGVGTVQAGNKIFVTVPSTISVTNGQKIKFIDSTAGAGAVDITAGNVTTNSAVLSFVGKAGNDAGILSGTGEDLYLVATRLDGGYTSMSGLASTAAGRTLEAIAVAVPTPGSAMATVVNTFNSYSTAQLKTELSKLAPITGVAVTTAAMGSVGQALNLVTNTRLASARGNFAKLAGNGEKGMAAGDVPPGHEMWGKGFGTQNKQDAYDGFNGYKANTYGIAIGGDTPISNVTRVGLGFSYARTDVDQQDAAAGSNSKINSYQVIGYGTHEMGQTYVDGLLSYAHHDMDNIRLAALGSTAKSSTKGNQWSARVGAGYRIAMSGKMVFTPLASLEASRFNQDAYTESGAGALSLNVNAVSTNRVKSGLGFLVGDEDVTRSGMVFKPEMHWVWYHDFKDEGVDTTSNFTGGGASFTTTGQKLKKDSYNLGAGVTFLQGKSSSVAVMYDYEGRSGFTGSNLQLLARWAF